MKNKEKGSAGADKFIAKFPQPPTSNKTYTINKYTHQKVLTAEAKNYKKNIINQYGIFKEPLFKKDIELRVEYHWFPPDNRKRDWDNIIKLLQDILGQGKRSIKRYAPGIGVWWDDCQIIEAITFKHAVERLNAGVVVIVCPFSEKRLKYDEFIKPIEGKLWKTK